MHDLKVRHGTRYVDNINSLQYYDLCYRVVVNLSDRESMNVIQLDIRRVEEGTYDRGGFIDACNCEFTTCLRCADISRKTAGRPKKRQLLSLTTKF